MGGAAKSSTGPGALGAGRPGPVRSALRAALDEARSAERMTTEHELRAVVAERIAHAVDRAAAAGDEARLLKASATLLELVDTLPVRSGIPGGGAGDGGDGGRAAAALRLLDSPPEVGDAAHS